VLEQGHRGD
jgi:ribosomal protein L3